MLTKRLDMKNFTQNPPLDSELSKFNIQNWRIEIVLKTILLFLALITFENSIAKTTTCSGEIKEVNYFLSSQATSICNYEKADHLISDSNIIIYINDNIKNVG